MSEVLMGEVADAPLMVRGLSVRYGGVQAVTDVDLDVPYGQIIGLIGPNGAGKTSFIDGITGFARPSAGSVRLHGREISGMAPNRRARVGLVRTFQGVEIFNDLTVDENISVGRRASIRGRERSAPPVLDVVGLSDVADRHASDLAQGGRRLLALARALVCDPAVLVLDEPAAGLDTDESADLGRKLRGLVDDTLGILLVDHDMSLVLAVCDLVYVLDFGRLIAVGTPDEIVAHEEVARAYLGGG